MKNCDHILKITKTRCDNLQPIYITINRFYINKLEDRKNKILKIQKRMLYL